MVRKAKSTTQHRSLSFAAARRRALARLRKGVDLQSAPSDSREAVHDRHGQSRQPHSSHDHDTPETLNGKAPSLVAPESCFADLGLPDAAERQAKLRLADALNRVLEARKPSQANAAKVLRVTQPKGSALRHYKLAGFSVERLT